MSFKLFASFLSLTLCGLICRGGQVESDWYIRQFTPASKLSSPCIRKIIQDSRGYIWIGTDNGIDRYDGYRLKHIEMPGDCVGYDSVNSICEDDLGKIWIGSFNGICVYDSATETVSKYSEGTVADIVKSRDGALWVAANYAGFLRIDPATGVCDSLKYEYHNPSAHFGNGLCYDGADKVYFINGVGTVYRVDSLDDRELKIESFWTESPFKMLHINDFFYNNGYIVGGVSRHTVFYNTLDKTFKEADLSSVVGNVRLHDKNIMVTSTGVYIMDMNMDLVGTYDTEMGEKIPSAVCLDRQGTIWLGTTYSGVLRMMPNLCRMKHIAVGGSPYSMVEDPGGSIWINTRRDGLKKYDGVSSMSDVKVPVDTKEMLAVELVGGDIIVGANTINSPLAAIDWRSGAARTIPYAPATMYSCLELDKNSFLEGAQGRPGIVDRVRKRFSRFETVRTTASSIIRDRNGAIWYTTTSTGLWSQKDTLWTHYTTANSGVSMQIKSAYSDADGVLWLATFFNGIQRFEPWNGKIDEINNFGGSKISEVRKIVEDREGILWAATPQGLATIDRRNLKTSLYTVDDGLDYDDYGITTLLLSSGGLLYVSTEKGLTVFDPLAFRKREPGNFSVSVTGISATGRLNSPDRELFSEYEREGRIVLGPHENTFTVSVSQMDYMEPRQSFPVYRIDGHDAQWHSMDAGAIHITNLPAGKYNLVIALMGRSGKLLGDAGELTVPVVVCRPFFATFPMILLYFAVVLCAVLLIVRSVKKRAVKRAQQESERQLYESKERFLTDLAHEIRTPLALVRAPVDAMREKLSKTADLALREDFDIISRNSEKLSTLLEELLDMNKFDVVPERAADASGNQEKKRADIPEFDIPRERPTVLVVDDNDDMRSFISNNLKEQYNVISATDGLEALQLMDSLKFSLPSIILSDVMMPRMNGYELCREIRKNPRYSHLPVILLTARGDVSSRILGLDFGADAYISKPFDIKELQGVIRRLILNRELVTSKYNADDSKPKASDADTEFLRKLDSHIREVISDSSLNVTSLAAYMCMSESTLFKKMKTLLGKGPNEYIQMMRLKAAENLLREGRLSVSDIAIKVGFNSPAYFSNCFRKVYGISPTTYMGRYRNM